MEWLTVQEYAGIGGLPTHPYHVRKRLDALSTTETKRKREGTKAFEYHISILPPETQLALFRREGKVKIGDDIFDIPKEKDAEERYCRETLWDRWNKSNERAQERAKQQLEAVRAVYSMMRNGLGKMKAIDFVSNEYGMSKMTIRRCCKKVDGIDEADWLPALLDKKKEAAEARRKNMFAYITPEAWTFFKSDYLRLEKPSLSTCYLRLKDAAKHHGWTVPSQKSLERRLRDEVSRQERVLLRQGEHAAAMLYPPQIRSVEHMHAMQHLNGDGYQHNVFVRWFNGKVVRPKTWFWQDVYSRKIVGWRIDLSENKDSIRLSLMDVFAKYGIPKDITIDNTRAAANKDLTGGKENRYRFKVKPDDPKGILTTLLGADHIHWTSVILGKGHGQAKPIERAFGVGGLDEIIDKHPACAGAYTGPNPMDKPDNYASNAIDVEEFIKVVEKGVELYNSKPNRNTEICQGFMSFEQAFNKSYETSVIRKATAPQLHMLMLSTETVRVSAHGTVELLAGETLKRERNRYEADELIGYAGKKVLVRFDPQNLHGEVEIYTTENTHICTAVCSVKRGFNERGAGREQAKHRKQFLKATKDAAQAQDMIDALEVAAQMAPLEEEVLPESKVVEPYRPVAIGNTAAKVQLDAEEELDEDLEANYAANLAYLVEQKNKDRL